MGAIENIEERQFKQSNHPINELVKIMREWENSPRPWPHFRCWKKTGEWMQKFIKQDVLDRLLEEHYESMGGITYYEDIKDDKN